MFFSQKIAIFLLFNLPKPLREAISSVLSSFCVIELHPFIKRFGVMRVPSEIIKVGVVTIDMSSIGKKFENFVQAGWQGFRFAPWAHCVLPKAHYFAQTGALFLNIFRIASTITCGYPIIWTIM